MLVGYARVSTGGQDPSYQVQALEGRGCERIFTERCSAREVKRPQLKATLDFLRKGDSMVVWKFDRLARSVTHLISLGRELERRECQLVSLTEGIDTTTPGGRLVFTMFGALAEFEEALNRERTAESYRAAKATGKRWGRPSPFHDPENVRVARAMLADRSVPRSEIAKRFGVNRNVIYRWFPGGDPDAFTGQQHGRRAV